MMLAREWARGEVKPRISGPAAVFSNAILRAIEKKADNLPDVTIWAPKECVFYASGVCHCDQTQAVLQIRIT
jgi:hypothetical protein